MSTSAAKAAPKSFTQLKNVTAWFSAMVGGYYGWAEKSANDKMWWEHHRARWAKASADEAEAKKKATAHLPKAAVPEIVPEELHGLYKEFAGESH